MQKLIYMVGFFKAFIRQKGQIRSNPKTNFLPQSFAKLSFVRTERRDYFLYVSPAQRSHKNFRYAEIRRDSYFADDNPKTFDGGVVKFSTLQSLG